MRQPSGEIAILGAGRAGHAIQGWLRRLGLRVPQPLRRGQAPPPTARVLILAVPDDALPQLAEVLAHDGRAWRGKIVLHLSGAAPAAVLAPLHRAGAAVGAMHPMMTFGTHHRTAPASGVVFGIEGDTAARCLAADWVAKWGGETLYLNSRQKPAYHLACTLVSPAVVVDFAAAEAVLHAAGFRSSTLATARRGLIRLLEATLANLAVGPTASAWTGPWQRGDAKTIISHRKATPRQLRTFYTALSSTGRALLPSGTSKRRQ